MSGRTRAIALYFMRIVLLFFAFYLPNIVTGTILVYATKSMNKKFWLLTVQHVFIPLQCLVTLRFAITKHDIQKLFEESYAGVTLAASARLSAIRNSVLGSNIEYVCNDKTLHFPDDDENQDNEIPTSEWEKDDVYEDRSIRRFDEMQPETK